MVFPGYDESVQNESIVVKNIEQQPSKPDELFAVAQFGGCFGIKGFIKVIPLTHSPERLEELETVLIGKSDVQTSGYRVEKVEFQARAILMKLEGIDDRTQAERFVGNYLFVPESELWQPPKGSWFIHDIVGCEAYLEDGSLVGTVKEVWKMPATDLWEITYKDKPVMFPAAKEFIINVDVKAKRIVIAPPDGLLEV